MLLYYIDCAEYVCVDVVFFVHSSSSFGFYYDDVGDKKKQLSMSVCVC